MERSDFDSTLREAIDGSEAAWQLLYDGHAAVVLRFLRARGAADPDNLLGDVFLQVVENIGRFTGGERQFRAWLLTIARHRAIDESRRRDRRPEDLVDDPVLVAWGPAGDTQADAAHALAHSRILEALAELPSDQRDVLFLRILADLKIDEVARVLGKRSGAVKALQARAINALRRNGSLEGVAL